MPGLSAPILHHFGRKGARPGYARGYLGDTLLLDTHLLHIYTKLGVRDRASAVAAAYKRGLLG